METDQLYYIDLITSYFSGELNSEEIQILSGIMSSSPENKKIFEDYANTWQLLEQDAVEKSVDVNKEWLQFSETKKLRSFDEIESDFINKTPVKNLKFTLYARIAAIFILVALSSVWFYSYLNKTTQQVLTASNTSLETTLSDGSHITLNSGATISYPSHFANDKRKMTLDGEACFEVKHDEAHPFLITSGNVCIEVLGTSFYVNTKNASGNVEVVLTSGKVAVYYADKPENKIILAPGERIEVPKTEQQLTKTINADENYLAWKTKKIVFNDQPLSNIVQQLNKVYHTNITISQADIADYKMTATFDHQELNSVLNVIKATLDVNITKKGDTFVIGRRNR